MQLEGKVALVTGGGRGLGRAYCEALAGVGASVVAADIIETGETVAAVERAGGKAIGVQMDVADNESCQAGAAKALDAFGRIDILINNAAVFADLKGGRFDSISEDQWDLVMAVNIKGLWQCCKACVPAMREVGGGSIINIASLAAVYGMPFAVDYSTSKGAVIGMTRSLARELGRDWIRVNAVAPSAVDTEGATKYFGDKKDHVFEVIAGGQALKCNLSTEDLTGTIIYLASDASKFVTGQTIMVDGGTVML